MSRPVPRPRRRRRTAAALAPPALLALLVVAPACTDDAAHPRSETYGLPSTIQTIEARQWVLDRGDSSLEVPDDNPVTLSVADGRVTGSGPCNAFGGSFTLDDHTVDLGDLATTRRACPEPVMRAEDEVLAALEAVHTVELAQPARLVLTGPGDVRLSFTGVYDRELLTGTWAITHVGAGESAESVVPGTDPTVTFDPSGELTVATGCNQGGSSWTLAGSRLAVARISLTAMACEDPPGVGEQETAIVRALEAAATVQVTPERLTILDGNATIALVAVPAP